MKALKKLVKLTAIALVTLIFLFFLSPMCVPARSGKPRGNQWVLIECRIFLNVARLAKTNSFNFVYSKLSDEEKIHAINIGRYFDFWARTNFAWENSANREVVIVCQKQFDNFPKPGFWNSFRKNPAHAVGYSDGRTGLISPEQYTALNLSGFESFSNLITSVQKR